MSLVVSAFWRDPATGELHEHTDWSDGHYMAGVESARSSLWGSEAVLRRGAKFLPWLRAADLWVEPEELEAFVAEVQVLLEDVDAIRRELGRDRSCSLPHYLHNFLRAASYARARGGGVSIT